MEIQPLELGTNPRQIIIREIIHLLPPLLGEPSRWPFYLSAVYLYFRALQLINLRQRVSVAVPECDRQIELIQRCADIISIEQGNVDVKEQDASASIAAEVNKMQQPFPAILLPFQGYYPREYGVEDTAVQDNYYDAVQKIVTEMGKLKLNLSPGLPSDLPIDIMGLIMQETLSAPNVQQAILENRYTLPALLRGIRMETGQNLTAKQYVLDHPNPIISSIRHNNLPYLQQLLANKKLNGYEMFCACMLPNLEKKVGEFIIEHCVKFDIGKPTGENFISYIARMCLNHHRYAGVLRLTKMITGESKEEVLVVYIVPPDQDVLDRLGEILSPLHIRIAEGYWIQRESLIPLTEEEEKITNDIVTAIANADAFNYYDIPRKRDAYAPVAAALRQLTIPYWTPSLILMTMEIMNRSRIVREGVMASAAYKYIIQRMLRDYPLATSDWSDIFAAGVRMQGVAMVDYMLELKYDSIATVMMEVVSGGITTPELAKAESKMYNYLLADRKNVDLVSYGNGIFYRLLDYGEAKTEEKEGKEEYSEERRDLFPPPVARDKSPAPVMVNTGSPVLALSSSPVPQVPGSMYPYTHTSQASPTDYYPPGTAFSRVGGLIYRDIGASEQ